MATADCAPTARIPHQVAFLAICLILALSGCQSTQHLREAGHPSDTTAMRYRLYDVALPLLLAASEACPFDREGTYGFILEGSQQSGRETQAANTPAVSVGHIHPRLVSADAGLRPGDVIEEVNTRSVKGYRADEVLQQIAKLTAARVQPLLLTVARGSVREQIALRAVPSCQFTPLILDTTLINGLSTGRQIAVTTGAMNALGSDDELAWVVAHEIAHNVLGHPQNAKLNAMLSALRPDPKKSAPSPTPPERRSIESQADYVGVYLMARAGYDLDAVRRVWDLFRRMESQAGNPTALITQTHPTTEERQAALRSTLTEIQLKLANEEPLDFQTEKIAPPTE